MVGIVIVFAPAYVATWGALSYVIGSEIGSGPLREKTSELSGSLAWMTRRFPCLELTSFLPLLPSGVWCGDQRRVAVCHNVRHPLHPCPPARQGWLHLRLDLRSLVRVGVVLSPRDAQPFARGECTVPSIVAG